MAALRREILHRRASPENPVKWEDIERKFNANVDGLLEPAAGERLLQLGSGLERLAKVTAINDIVAARSQGPSPSRHVPAETR